MEVRSGLGLGLGELVCVLDAHAVLIVTVNMATYRDGQARSDGIPSRYNVNWLTYLHGMKHVHAIPWRYVVYLGDVALQSRACSTVLATCPSTAHYPHGAIQLATTLSRYIDQSRNTLGV